MEEAFSATLKVCVSELCSVVLDCSLSLVLFAASNGVCVTVKSNPVA